MLDLLNKVLNTDFDQGAVGISEVKVRGGKEHLPTQPSLNQCAWGRLSGQIFFRPPTLTFDIFEAPKPKSMFSTSFKISNTFLFLAGRKWPLNEF